ncbi:MAG: glutathione-regulated potassium-efflux system oxidoreductase KefF [Longimicrobiales bacterium]
MSCTHDGHDSTLHMPMDSDSFPSPILILFAHPAFQKSRVNRVLVDEVMDLPGVTFHDLYEAYPVFDIDVAREQELLLAHEVVVFHHPFFWYSTPAILKEWQDLVLEHGWAYGSKGTALRGKTLLSAITTGGREEAYQPDGYNRFTIQQLLAPIEQTARLCGMDYLPPFVAHGTHRMKREEMEAHARDYRRILEALRDRRLDLEAARTVHRLNAAPDRVIRE